MGLNNDEVINEVQRYIKQKIKNEIIEYRKRLGIDMTHLEIIAFTAGIYAGLDIVIELTEEPEE